MRARWKLRPVRWWRVPVKFVGGMGTLGAGMVLVVKDRWYSLAASSKRCARSSATIDPLKAVFTGVIMSSTVFRIFNGEAAI